MNKLIQPLEIIINQNCSLLENFLIYCTNNQNLKNLKMVIGANGKSITDTERLGKYYDIAIDSDYLPEFNDGLPESKRNINNTVVYRNNSDDRRDDDRRDDDRRDDDRRDDDRRDDDRRDISNNVPVIETIYETNNINSGNTIENSSAINTTTATSTANTNTNTNTSASTNATITGNTTTNTSSNAATNTVPTVQVDIIPPNTNAPAIAPVVTPLVTPVPVV